jgi:DNA-binding MarR family transcriptional regulator
MPRLDAARVDAWRDLTSVFAELTRQVDEDLQAQWDIPLAWFEVLAALQRLGGAARPSRVATAMRLPPSSLSRRLDRLADEGWVERHRGVAGADGRAVVVELTRRGRNLWREMNVTYRRSVQRRFAAHLSDLEIDAIAGLIQRLDEAMAAFERPEAEDDFAADFLNVVRSGRA